MDGRLALLAWSLAFCVVQATDPTVIDDANLRAVHFIDENEGWAVGDDGVILHTANKGRNWDLQPSGTSDTLTSIHMLGAHEGWIVGRRPMPYQTQTVGRMLVTTVGGIRWMPVDKMGQFPGLNQIRFLDTKKAWLVGDVTDRKSTGIWYTTDAGQSWATLPQKTMTPANGWLSATALDFNNGVLVGRNGGFANLRTGNIKTIEANVRPGVTLRDSSRSGVRTWVVGDRAHVLYSDDAGVSWQRAKLPIPDEMRNSCDFYAVSSVGDSVWIAGRPGSLIMHSADNGANWTIQKTGVAMPIYGMHFPTDKHGYAVGGMGTLLRTEDGGQTWIPSWDPQIGRRAAVLYITADARTVPLSSVARYGAEEGYYAVSLAMTGPDLSIEPPSAAYQSERNADAFRAAGGVLCETRNLFPLARDRFEEPVESILTGWNKRLEATASVELVRDIAMAIRMYRPYVVVMEAIPPKEVEGGVRGLLARSTVKALQAAGEANEYPELQSIANLPPHRPVKILSLVGSDIVDDGKIPVLAHSSSDLGTRIGKTYAEVASAAMAFAADEYCEAEPVARFAMLQSAVEEAAGKDMLAVLRLRPGAEARRKLRTARELTAEEIRQIDQRKALLAIATNGQNVIKPEQVIGGLQGVTKSLSPDKAGDVTFRFARKFVDTGRWDLAKDAFEHLVKKYPEQSLSAEALKWLIGFRVSNEARLRFGSTSVVGSDEIQVTKQGKAQTKGKRVETRPRSEEAKWANEALQYATGLQAVAKNVAGQAKTQLMVAAALRKVENTSGVKLVLDGIAANDPYSRWSRIVEQERFATFGQVDGAPPKMMLAGATRTRPKLDGVLTDDCWKGLAPVQLGERNANPASKTMVYFRYDDNYLYMAADCAFSSPDQLKPAVEKRTRDGNVTPNDRIELFIDVDRDYTSFYRLRIDATGEAAEDCWGDVNWNPKWYVATSADEKGYRVEAAIPLSVLAIDITKMESQTWAANIQRVMPGHGVVAFSTPASHDPRSDGFVLLKFEPKGQAVLGQ